MIITILIKSYLGILMAVSFSTLLGFILGLYWLLKRENETSIETTVSHSLPKQKLTKLLPQDLAAIAGEDQISTQLDLARAFVESNRKRAAKKMLANVIEQGNSAQQQEAKLLAQLCE